MDKENNNNEESKSFKKQLINFGIVCIIMTPIIILLGISLAKSNAVEKEIEKSKNSTIYDKAYMADNFEVLSQDIEEINAQIDSMSVTLNELQEKLDALESALKLANKSMIENESEITVDDLVQASNLGIIMPCNKCGNPDVELRNYTTNEGQTRFYIHCPTCYPDENYDFSDEFGYASPYECIYSWNFIYGLPSD